SNFFVKNKIFLPRRKINVLVEFKQCIELKYKLASSENFDEFMKALVYKTRCFIDKKILKWMNKFQCHEMVPDDEIAFFLTIEKSLENPQFESSSSSLRDRRIDLIY
ncbi:hypothetical protein L9F63_003307, partial [Diploptera punctata]